MPLVSETWLKREGIGWTLECGEESDVHVQFRRVIRTLMLANKQRGGASVERLPFNDSISPGRVMPRSAAISMPTVKPWLEMGRRLKLV